MSLPERLRALIEAEGAIPISRFMAEANAHYYASRDPLGAGGDFITAPEVSQMFGELVGLALAHMMAEAGQAADYVELGPGRGTLAADALRAMGRAGFAPHVHFVETSPVLRAAQAVRVPGATWHETIATLPADRPLLIVANEFFDALPISQSVNGIERMVRFEGDRFVADPIPSNARVVEHSPAAEAIMADLSRRLVVQGGALIAIDYGHAEPAMGDTLQALRGHRFVDPFVDPGESDITAHVDFSALTRAATAAGGAVAGPVAQGDWLVALGIDAREERLGQGNPDRRAELAAQKMRLIHPDQMGSLFKILGVSARGWPSPPGLG